MKATLEFNLPDENTEFQQASHAGELARAVDEIQERVRRRRDSGISEDEQKFLSDLIEYLAPVMPIVFGEHLI